MVNQIYFEETTKIIQVYAQFKEKEPEYYFSSSKFKILDRIMV